MSTHDLGDGLSVTLKDDVTVADSEKINRATHVRDPQTGQFFQDLFQGGLAAVAILVEEWNLVDSAGESVPISKDGARRLPIRVWRKLQAVLTEHLEGSEFSEED